MILAIQGLDLFLKFVIVRKPGVYEEVLLKK